MSTKKVEKTRNRLAVLFWGTMQLVAVFGVIGGTVLFSNYMRENQPERVPIEVQTFTPDIEATTVEVQTRRLSLQKTGSVEPAVYVNVSPEVSGVIKTVMPRLADGSTFEAGETLFEIFRDDLTIELRRREADLAAAVAALDIERAQAENARREWQSYGRGKINDMAAREPHVRSAEAQVLIAEAQLELATLNLERASYSLPFAGRVVETSLAHGQRVSAGQSYGRVFSFDSIEVSLSLSPDELALLKTVEETPALVTGRVLGKPVTLHGRIGRIAGEVDRGTRLTKIIVSLDAATVQSVGLQPGTFVTVSLLGPVVNNVAEIPNAALQENDQVWLLEGDRLRLSMGVDVVLRGQDTTLVTNLESGARIALGTIAGATNGMRIRPQMVLGSAADTTIQLEGVNE